MLDPSFEDGSDGNDPTSGRTSAAIMQSLMASLDAASLALDELEPAIISSLHTDAGYMKRVQRLMAPIFAFLGHYGGGSGGVEAKKQKGSSAPSTPPGPSKKKGDLVRVLSPDEPPPEAPFSRQLKLVEIFLQQDRHIGSSLGEGNYLVSAKWWNTWVDKCRISAFSGAGAQRQYAMYPVDNSDLLIIDPSTTEPPRLRSGLRVGALHPDVHSASSGSFVYVPKTVWKNCFERWFGVADYTLFQSTVSSGRTIIDPEMVKIFEKTANSLNTTVPPWKTGSRSKIVQQLRERQRRGGECYHLISKTWWTSWQLRDNDFPVTQTEVAHVMPIDNSELLNEYNRLRGGLRVNEDYYYIPPEAWYLLVAWYGNPHSHFEISRDFDWFGNIICP